MMTMIYLYRMYIPAKERRACKQKEERGRRHERGHPQTHGQHRQPGLQVFRRIFLPDQGIDDEERLPDLHDQDGQALRGYGINKIQLPRDPADQQEQGQRGDGGNQRGK